MKIKLRTNSIKVERALLELEKTEDRVSAHARVFAAGLNALGVCSALESDFSAVSERRSNSMKVFEIVLSRGSVERSYLTRRVCGTMDKNDVDAAIDELVSVGLISVSRTATGGRPLTIYEITQ